MKNKVKWIITLIVGIFLVAAVIGLAIKLDRSTDSERLGSTAYDVGTVLTVNSDTKKAGEVDTSVKTSIYTRELLEASKVTISKADDAKISFQVFAYGENKNFLGAYDQDQAMSTKYENVKYIRIVITPTVVDENITVFKVPTYANQLVVKLAK